MLSLIYLLVMSAVLYFLARPKRPKQEIPSIGETTVTTAETGRAIPVVFGSRWLTSPNVVWSGAYFQFPVYKTYKQ